MQSSKRHSLLSLFIIVSAPTLNYASLPSQPHAYVTSQPLKVPEGTMPLPSSLEPTPSHAQPAEKTEEKGESPEKQSDKSDKEADHLAYSLQSPEEDDEHDDNEENKKKPHELPEIEGEGEQDDPYGDHHEELTDENDSELAPEEEVGEWELPSDENEGAPELLDEQRSHREKLDATLEEEKRDHIVAEEIQYSAAPQSWSSVANRQQEREPVAPSYESTTFEMFNAPESEEFQAAMNDTLESFGITPEQAQEAMENATEEDIRQGMELAAKIIQDIEAERRLAEHQNTSDKNKGPKV